MAIIVFISKSNCSEQAYLRAGISHLVYRGKKYFFNLQKAIRLIADYIVRESSVFQASPGRFYFSEKFLRLIC